jgi:photosystem II stability/assembly factor-like uncharacterized protein
LNTAPQNLELKMPVITALKPALFTVGLMGLCALGPLGCPPPEDAIDDSDGGVGGAGGGGGAGGSNPDATWLRGDHPCGGGRTDALLHTEADTFYVGCGTGATGKGLWRTDDAGQTWAAEVGFELWRVNDLDLEGDTIVVAGTDTTSNLGIVRFSPGGDGTLTEVWRRGTVVDESFQVGHYASLPDGRAMAESLTGGGLVFRDAENQAFRGIYPFSSDGQGRQILSLTTADDGFWGVGSTIAEPPTIFAPSPEGDLPLIPILPLGEDISGELWGVANAGERLVAVGVDQDADAPILLVGEGDTHSAEGWRRVDLSDLMPAPSWLRGACGAGQTLVVVGEKQPLRAGTGRVLRSDDGGASWRDVSPDDGPESWSVCTLDAAGRLVVAGADGGFAVLD